MSINRVVIAGTFSFPFGEAASSRIRHLALGFKSHLADVHVVSLYHNDNSTIFKEKNSLYTEGVELPYSSLTPSVKETSNLYGRLSNRISFILLTQKLIDKVIEELRGDEEELLFLYGRSYLFLNPLLKKMKALNLKTKVVFDVVEPPRTKVSKTEYLFHPFVWDSSLIFKRLLPRFDACTFITHTLKEKFAHKVQKFTIIPSVIYTITPQSDAVNLTATTRIGYIGALIEKDYPELLYQLCTAFYEQKKPFELNIIGRFRNFDEGRQWEKKFLNSPFADSLHFHFDPDEKAKNDILNKIDFIALFRKPEMLQLYTFPTRVVEMLALGKVLIVNNFGDFSKYFIDRENAIVIATNDVPSSVKKITHLNNPIHYNQVTKEAFVLLNNAFNATVLTQKLLNLFL